MSDPEGNVSTISRRRLTGPGHRAGLRYGDKIVEVNGSPCRQPFSGAQIPRGAKAPPQNSYRPLGPSQWVDIVRDAVPQPSISEWYMIRPGVGYIAMRGGFNQTTYGEFLEAMRGLKAEGMRQLVIDLRDNGGGLVNQAWRVASSFLVEGQTVLTQRGRVRGANERYPALSGRRTVRPS